MRVQLTRIRARLGERPCATYIIANLNRECSMSQVAELDTAPETIEATLNYINNNGEKIFTETASPGGLDVRSGGTPDPHRVAIHNARHRDFVFERDGFRFVRHDTKMRDFFDEAEVRSTYYAEMEALVKQESGCKRVVVFD